MSGRTTSKKSKDEPVIGRTMAEILEAKKRGTRSVTICLDPALAEARDKATKIAGGLELLAARDTAPAGAAEEAAEARAKADEATAAAEAATVEFVFQALGRTELEDLMAEHKPTRAQQDALRATLKEQGLPPTERLAYNSETFPPALLAAAAVSPTMTLEEAGQLWNHPDVSRGEAGALLGAAFQVNDIVTS